MTEVEELGAELADFRRRVAELRSARALPRPEQLPSLDAALIELQHAADVLWPRYEKLAAEQRNGRRGDGHEQQLLRALFQRLPVPAMLLDRDTVVRRLNVAATQLFGTRAGYATGRSLATSLARDGRAAFRSQVAAVARGEGERSLVVHLLRPPDSTSPGSGILRATLCALRPPQEPRAAVLAVFQAAAGSPVPSPAGAPPARRPARPDLTEVTQQAELLDLVDDMAWTLLRTVTESRREAHRDTGRPRVGAHRSREQDREMGRGNVRAALDAVDAAVAGGSADAVDAVDTVDAAAEHAVDVKTVAARAAGVLYERFADWSIIDLVAPDGEELRRVSVLGSDDELRKALVAQDPAACPLVVEAVRHGTEVLQVRPESPEALGRDAAGAPILVRAAVSSMLCVPLVPDAAAEGSRPLGTLTLLRTGGRRAFELAEAGAADRMARHIALTLRGR